jgi:hypothetical protein
VPVVFVIAVLAVLVGVFYAATGRGGELAYEQTDHAPLDLGPVSAPDIALLRPPTALWGYNMQVTDEALDHIARAVRDRDITIAYLQEELANREPKDLNAPYGTVPPTRPDAFYPPTGREDHSQASADPYPLADPEVSRYPSAHAPSDVGLGSTASSDEGAADTIASGFGRPYTMPPPYAGPADYVPSDAGPSDYIPSDAGPSDAGSTDYVPSDAGAAATVRSDTGPADPAFADPVDAAPAPATPEAPPPPRSLTPPGILVASRPREVPRPQEVPEANKYTQSAEATRPYDVAESRDAPEPHDATQPHEIAEPHDATQPYEIAEPHDATQPYGVAEPHDVMEPHEATQPYGVAESHHAPEPHDATQPTGTLPAADDTLGPQGPFDTHDWWAEQEEAAREDARRQPEAENVGLALFDEPHAPAPPGHALSGSAAEDNEPPDEAADQASTPPGPTGTVPNPVVSPPSQTGTSSGDADQPPAGPAKPLTPHDDGLSIAEEQSW